MAVRHYADAGGAARSGIRPGPVEAVGPVENRVVASAFCFPECRSLSNRLPLYAASSGVFSMTPTAYVFKDVGVLPAAPNAGGGAMTSFSQTFSGGTGGGGTGSGAEVPEPMTLVLVGPCLLALVLLRERGGAG